MAVAAAATAAGGDAAAAAIPRRVAGPSLAEREAADRRGPQLTEQVLEVWEAAQPRRRQLEGEEGGVSQKGAKGAGGRRRLERQGKKGRSGGERGHLNPTRPPKELPCTWCDEICLEGYTNKKNHHPTGFGMTNNRH